MPLLVIILLLVLAAAYDFSRTKRSATGLVRGVYIVVFALGVAAIVCDQLLERKPDFMLWVISGLQGIGLTL